MKKTIIPVGFVLLFAMAMVSSEGCACNGKFNAKGSGECQTTHEGRPFCYVPSGQCTDEKESRKQAGWFWSYKACTEGEGTSSSECETVGGNDTGAFCVFPFIYKNKVYHGCTLAWADDGKYWCSTKVDKQGVHMGGVGKWGHCGQDCTKDEDVSSLKFYIGVVLPKVAPSGFYTFDLCQGELCSEAGEVATFGIDSNPIQNILPVDQETHRVIEYDVTHLVTKSRCNRRSNIGYLSAKLTSSVVHGLPEPVIIYRDESENTGGIVAMAEEQEPRDYGNLLAKYDVRNEFNICAL